MANRAIAHREGGGAPAAGGIDPQAHVDRVVARSGTSFLWGMRMLPAERRRAMRAIYAFCREVDDIADEPGDVAEKRRALAAWRAEIGRLYDGRPEWPTTRALLGPARRFGLPRAEFLAVIEGMEIDAAPAVRMPTLDDLLGYCRKVAGAVGMLSIHAFGAPEPPGPRIAETLGDALQLTNILRDPGEDAALGRLYAPMDMLARHGAPAGPPEAAIAHPGFAAVRAELAGLARDRYAEAAGLIADRRGRELRPAAVMMAVYRETLDRLEARGWERIDGRVRLSRPRKAWLALRHGLL